MNVCVQQFLGLSRIPHYATLQEAAARLTHGMLIRIPESFVLQTRIRKMFAGIDSSGLSHGQASFYYTKHCRLRRRFVKISICADMKRQIVCGIVVRHRFRNDSVDFAPLLERAVRITRVGTLVADRRYDSECNHILAEGLGIRNTIIRPKYENLQVCMTRGFHRNGMK